MLIRDAVESDLPTICAIYNDAVATTTAIWNERQVDVANRAAWRADRTGGGYPVLVAIAPDGSVAGYASFGAWRPHDGYRHTVEHSVYVERSRRGGGVGRRLLLALIDRARVARKHAMIAAIESGNEASIRLHRSLGFEITGQMPQVGVKFGRWLDLTFMQLVLDDQEPD